MRKALFCVALLLSGAASAQQPSNNSSDGAGTAAQDPNQMICRTIRETGSMLGRSRVCLTRAQWEDHRRQTRQNIDRAQTTRTNPGGN